MNPVEVEIHRHMFESVAEEMGIVLRGTALSANIKERLDFSCAINGATGAMIAQAAHIPVHLGSCHLTAARILEEVPLEPGDAVILNDPFRGGTHLPDITVFVPVFVPGESRPRFGTMTRAHHADVGGGVPGSMGDFDELYKEGLVIPPVRIVRAGKLDTDIEAMILANVRTPDERRGDLRAQLAATERGARRMLDLVERYGAAALAAAADALLERSAAAVRDVITEIPDGCYRFRDELDGKGSPRIATAITVKGSTMTVDFTGSSPTVARAVNAHEAITLSAVFYCLRCLADESIPTNSGCLEPVELVIPPDTIVGARRPAAVAGGTVETSQRIVDTIFGALARALPDRIPAASQGTMNNLSFGGRDADGRAFTYFETIAGGCGASRQGPGASGVHSHMTNTLNTPIEALEIEFPVRVTAYHLRDGSGGDGRYPGGDGVVREIEARVPMSVTVLGTRRSVGPWGLAGGKAGRPGTHAITGDGVERPLDASETVFLEVGQRIRIETPGGGGWGRLRRR